jgi:ribonuclease HI
VKLLKLSEEIIKDLKSAEENVVVVSSDTDLSVGERVELINSKGANIGEAEINEINIRKYSDVENDEGLKQQLEHLNIEVGSNVKLLVINYKSNRTVDNVASKHFDTVKTYSDGGSRGNPGPSASGYVVLDMDDNVLHEEGIYLGLGTNNNAEYLSLKFALEKAKELGAKTVYAFMDSQLVINQMNGIYKIKHPGLFEIYKDIKQLEKDFAKVSYQHVPRALNKLADAEVNKSLDAQNNRIY